MDYEKAYKEAFERAKQVHASSVDENKKSAEYIFPELQESEDEKIRKILINLVVSNGTAYYINKIHKDKIFAWLEKQGEQKPPIVDFKAKNWYVSKVDGKIHDMTYNPDKVEPKFKVGDWVVRKDGGIFCSGYKFTQICKIDDKERYLCDNYFGVKKEDIRLWTIEDAKDGDVLISSFDKPFIYNTYFDSVYVGAYCGLGLNDEFIITDGQPNYFYWTANFTVRPAAEKEIELLFNNMKEAGYKWDADKKEPIKF